MDAVFKALADPTRRSLLDHLFERDGQSLTELEERLPMTRFGVIEAPEAAGGGGAGDDAATTGATKLHYLNPVPIRLVHDAVGEQNTPSPRQRR